MKKRLPVTNGSLRIAVVADTHSAPHPKAGKLIAALSPDHILHAGDIGRRTVLDELAKIAPVTAVRGNIDEVSDLQGELTIELVDGDDTLLTILLMHIAVNGPKLRAPAVRLAEREGAQLVICGHSHVPFIGRDKNLAVFNPGSVGPRRFHLPIVFGVMELANGRLFLKHVDCETGHDWKP